MEALRNCPRLSVVMPVYNERDTIEEILERVAQVTIEKEVIVVDDGSTDGTREILQKLAEELRESATIRSASRGTRDGKSKGNIRIFFEEKNRGKGAALRRGFREAQGEVVIVQDADLEYDPGDYYRLLEPIERGLADVVYGSRFLGGPHRVLFFWHSVANKLLTILSNMFTGMNLSDVWTCYKAFKRDVLKEIELREDRFGFEPEVTAKIARGGWRVYEVPISYHGRTYAEGKKITWRDGVRGIWVILRCGVWR
ncbi:MAG TPA: glycosyltransferase family 2 protein [Chloroflexota bacterium]|jgi:glycosyltransferase involved in cell wall biosynthesis